MTQRWSRWFLAVGLALVVSGPAVVEAHEAVDGAVALVKALRAGDEIRDDIAAEDLAAKLARIGELADGGDPAAARDRLDVLVQDVKRLGLRVTDEGARQLLTRIAQVKAALGS